VATSSPLSPPATDGRAVYAYAANTHVNSAACAAGHHMAPTNGSPCALRWVGTRRAAFATFVLSGVLAGTKARKGCGHCTLNMLP
jgi:hypothetical protein